MVVEKVIYKKPDVLKDNRFTFCAGCGHGIVYKLLAEVIDELGIRDETIGVCPVGCAVFGYDFLDIDIAEAPHGRASAVATGVKRIHPDKIVFSYQGDGDILAIGVAEIIHTANRGENLFVLYINNANYGMTGGQMAPTTLLDQVTTTTPYGRNAEHYGYPMKLGELLAPLEGVKYIERVKVSTPASILKIKKAIKKSFLNQMNGVKGLSLLEVLSPCPESWKKSPKDAVAYVEDVMSKYYPVGVIKDVTK